MIPILFGRIIWSDEPGEQDAGVNNNEHYRRDPHVGIRRHGAPARIRGSLT